jgi:hypothetical protein
LCLFLCQYHAVFITMALDYNLKSGIVVPLVWNQDCFDIQALLHFHMNSRIDFSLSLKNAIGILLGIALTVDCFWWYSQFSY